jgi:hypothetical protein
MDVRLALFDQVGPGMGMGLPNGFGLAAVLAIAAAILLGIVSFLWGKLLSFLSDLFYPVRVHGRWTTKIKRAGQWADHESAQLYQFGPRVWGYTTTTDDEKRRYRIVGRITGEKLCMIYRERKSLDTGGILLQIGNKGDTMEGYELGCNLDDKGFSSREYKWTAA